MFFFLNILKKYVKNNLATDDTWTPSILLHEMVEIEIMRMSALVVQNDKILGKP